METSSMPRPVITRIWHGRTLRQHADEYLNFLLHAGTEEYRLTPGNLSCQIWRRVEEEVCHFWTVTRWESLDSVKAFAGEDYEKAKYYAEDSRYLLEFEPTVLHTETFDLWSDT